MSRAIETLVPLIAAAPSTSLVRHRWLQLLWASVEDDDVAYLESLTEFWGELCGSPETASEWADATPGSSGLAARSAPYKISEGDNHLPGLPVRRAQA